MNQNCKQKNPLENIVTHSLEKEMEMDMHGVSFKRDLAFSDTLLSVRHLKMFFPMGQHSKLKAVHDVSFDIKKGECFGLVGESGCGKTTTGRSIIRLYHITSGSVYFKGYRINAGCRWNEKEIKWTIIRGKNRIKELRQKEKAEIADMGNSTLEQKQQIEKVKADFQKQIDTINQHTKFVIDQQQRKIQQIKYDDDHVDRKLMSKMQMIFQDPIDSLDPRMTVEDIIQEGLKIQGYRNKAENHQKACQVLEEVGLIPDYCSRYPNEFSGGQRQRIGIARAIVMNPEFLICDEPISALDVSIRAQIINLLNDLKEHHGLTLMFIAHDLSVVKYFCDRIAVMYFGEMVEMAPSDELFAHPLHPYTRALLSAIPKPDPLSEKKRKRIVYNPAKEHDYSKEKPTFQEILPGHYVLANSVEIARYQDMIKADDVKNAKKEAEEKKLGTEY
jgi:oligopeptide transport system ATP-binding protein